METEAHFQLSLLMDLQLINQLCCTVLIMANHSSLTQVFIFLFVCMCFCFCVFFFFVCSCFCLFVVFHTVLNHHWSFSALIHVETLIFQLQIWVSHAAPEAPRKNWGFGYGFQNTGFLIFANILRIFSTAKCQ